MLKIQDKGVAGIEVGNVIVILMVNYRVKYSDNIILSLRVGSEA